IKGALVGYVIQDQSIDIIDSDPTTVTLARASTGAISEAGGSEVVTVTLGRVLAAGESVTVPLAASGATAGTHYTLTLRQTTGASLDTTSPYSVQNPAVTLSGAGANSAVLVLTAIDNSDKVERAVSISYGTGARTPSSSGLGGGISTAGGPLVVTIYDDDSAITIAAATAAEGSALEFTVTLPEVAPAGGITVNYGTSDGRGRSADYVYQSAIAGQDYTAAPANALIAIPADSRSGTITVQTTDDSTYETDHYLTVSLAGSDGSWGISSAAGSAVGTITDEADVPVFEFSASTSKVAENAGSAAIKITRTGESVVASTLSYATSAISATADEDYVSQTKGSLSFAPADATRTVMVTITDDVTDETDETFVLDLSAVTHARIGTTARHTVTIQDNDSVPAALTLSASLNEVAEDAGATEVTVTATLDGASVFDTDKTVQVSVGGGTATSTEDYAAVSSFGIKIAAGQASGSGKFTLTPIDDVLDEADSETVQVTGALVGVSVTADEIAITDNDAAPSVITLTVDADTGTDNVQSELAEGGGAKTVEVTATITGSTQFESDRTVILTVSGDTATAIDDYADVAAQSIVIQAGEAAGTTEFEIAPVDDNIDEPTEAISIEGELSGVTVTGTSVDITDNDETPSALTIEVDTDTATDGSQDSVGEDAGTVTVRVKAVLDGASTFAELKNVTVTVGDSSDSATETNDYASVDDFTISIAAGQSSGFADISLKPKNDAVDESDESITIKGVLTGVTVTNDEIIIIDADQPPQVILKLTPSSIDESGNGNVSVVTASLTGGTSSETVKLTVSATAVSPAVEGDYTLSANKVLTIAPETVDSSGLVTIAAVDNQVFAAAKVVTVSAEVSGTSGVANPDSVDLTINEDDAAPAGLTLSVSPSNVGEQDGDSSVTVTAMLDGGITFTEDTTVTVSVGDGSAVSPGDYAPVDDFKIAIPAGQSS
ncbi:MAG: hypothetical protein F4Z97_01410, partial [Gammaproteobacteria bacterium]|nr:hypothetical protein [Gammaproteobacteria bacterium]